ncbi:S8 family serine peptidase [Fulvivirga sp. M361]|uniref:S8 family serine peptidase n=1 Tax=Fulvivirga sp. M361 TaxID=2594266 RepID=UPI0016293562|nr:S8 family serine peptidase [Fulvivirga sp. M361]
MLNSFIPNMYSNFYTQALLLSIVLICCQCAAPGSVVLKDHVGTRQNSDFTYKRTALDEEQMKFWYQMDPLQDSVPGISLARMQRFLSNRKGEELIIGIIDSGIDTGNFMLKRFIWTNDRERKSNEVDDDNNGYTDDIYGWNFLGNGTVSIKVAPYALTRMMARLEQKAEGKLLPKDMKNENYWKLKTIFEKEQDKASQAYTSAKNWFDPAKANDIQRSYFERIENQNRYQYNIHYDAHDVIGDDVNDLSDRNYGNPDISPVDDSEAHGTQVASALLSVIASDQKGFNKSEKIKFMTLRAVPDGDEYDKDIALAIRYAVDNGAKVINMSFGKSYSERPDWVHEAIRYAADKDVLLVHAAGNDNENLDLEDYFPSDGQNGIEIAGNMINVGAITRFFNESLASPFSNYGKNEVDIFAPGSDIFVAGLNNKYDYTHGTSLAAPLVSGVAGLIRSYYPELSANQVKRIIIESSLQVNHGVLVPGGKGDEIKPFSELCGSGGILNAYNAMLLAESYANNLIKN